MSTMLTLVTLIAALSAQDAPTELFCVADPDGRIAVVAATPDANGGWRTFDGRSLVEPQERAEAQNADWYVQRIPIVWNGVRYAPEQSPVQVTALNRYLRHQGTVQGVPLYSWWPGGDRELAVLVEAQGCVFHTYSPASE